MADTLLATTDTPATPLTLVRTVEFDSWSAELSAIRRSWVTRAQFAAKSGEFAWLPGEDGEPTDLVVGWDGKDDLEVYVRSPGKLRVRVSLGLKAEFDKQLGADHPNTLRSMESLAIILARQNRFGEAEPLLLAMLEGRRRVLGDSHPETLSAVLNLAILFKNQGRNSEAEPLYLSVLDTQKRVLGDDHPGTIGTLYNLACFEATRGNPVRSFDWLSQAITAGFLHAEWMANDPDLVPLHGPEFDALVERARQNAAAQRAE